MADIPTIEPFQFIRSTAFSERVQLANKLNEVIDALNQIVSIDDLQTQIEAINSEISEIRTAIEDTNSDVSTLSNQVNTLVSEVNGLLKEVVSEVVLDAPEYGQVRVKVIHEDETETASNALQIPVIVDGGISLISGTTARSFKIRYITADGVTHTTNDFVIPEGGSGTDVTVTSVTILEGDTDNSFKFEIGLSDGSSIQSNSYPFPAASELTPATTTQLGGIKVGTHLSVTADGTLSVDMTQINTAAVASTVKFTADASKVTLHADSLAGSEFTKDIPQASQGGAGTIDQESYAKIATNQNNITTLQEEVSTLKGKVDGLTPSVSVNESADPPTITIGINGKSAQANLPAGGSLKLIKSYTSNNISEFLAEIGNYPIGSFVVLAYRNIGLGAVTNALKSSSGNQGSLLRFIGMIFEQNGGTKISCSGMGYTSSNPYVPSSNQYVQFFELGINITGQSIPVIANGIRISDGERNSIYLYKDLILDNNMVLNVYSS